MLQKWLIVHQLKGRNVQIVNYKENVMQITKNIVKFNKMLVSIPKAMKGIWDKSENRWGYRKISGKS